MKKLGTVIRYECVTSIKYLCIFYLALAAVVSILYGIHYFLTNDLSGGMNCLEMNTMIFLGILGILQLHEDFRMLMQNGFTRSYFFLGTISLFAFISCMMSLVDTIAANVLRSLTGGSYSTFFGSLYGYGHPAVLSWLWLFLIYMLVCSLTFFFSLAASNLSKKMALFAGVILAASLFGGISLLFGSSALESQKDRLIMLAVKSFGFMEDGTIRLIYPFMLLTVFAGILVVFSWLIMRRTELKV